jgi:hypothetical protein
MIGSLQSVIQVLRDHGYSGWRSTTCFYNFAHIYQSLRVTPAMEAGVADHVWSLDEVIASLGA